MKKLLLLFIPLLLISCSKDNEKPYDDEFQIYTRREAVFSDCY